MLVHSRPCENRLVLLLRCWFNWEQAEVYANERWHQSQQPSLHKGREQRAKVASLFPGKSAGQVQAQRRCARLSFKTRWCTEQIHWGRPANSQSEALNAANSGTNVTISIYQLSMGQVDKQRCFIFLGGTIMSKENDEGTTSRSRALSFNEYTSIAIHTLVIRVRRHPFPLDVSPLNFFFLDGHVRGKRSLNSLQAKWVSESCLMTCSQKENKTHCKCIITPVRVCTCPPSICACFPLDHPRDHLCYKRLN